MPWFRSWSGAELPVEVQRAAFANGVLLTECGSEQNRAAKPWLLHKFLSMYVKLALYRGHQARARPVAAKAEEFPPPQRKGFQVNRYHT